MFILKINISLGKTTEIYKKEHHQLKAVAVGTTTHVSEHS